MGIKSKPICVIQLPFKEKNETPTSLEIKCNCNVEVFKEQRLEKGGN